jgi:hypothetical protein
MDPRVTFRLSLFTAMSEPYFLVKPLVSTVNSICGASSAFYRCGEHISFGSIERYMDYPVLQKSA